MKLLTVNSRVVDIDSQTAIGFDLQSYDIKNPATRKVNVSNTFSVPLTINNQDIFGVLSLEQSYDLTMYSQLKCDYSENQLRLINGGVISVESVSDRIYLKMFNRNDIFSILKTVPFSDFMKDYINVIGLPNFNTAVFTGLQNFLNPYQTVDLDTINKKVVYSFHKSNLDLIREPELIKSRIKQIDATTIDSGCFCIYFESIFRYIELKYNVNFDTQLQYIAKYSNNCFNDTLVKRAIVNTKNLTVQKNNSGAYYFSYANELNFTPLEVKSEKEEKNLFDLIDIFFKHFNIIIDSVFEDGKEILLLQRFDSLEDAEVIDLSENITGQSVFKPYIDGLSQINLIKNSKVFEGGSDDYNGRYIACTNINIDDKQNELFEINQYAAGVFNFPESKYIRYIGKKLIMQDVAAINKTQRVSVAGNNPTIQKPVYVNDYEVSTLKEFNVIDLSVVESMNEFTLMIIQTSETTQIGRASIFSGLVETDFWEGQMHLTGLYELNSEYNYFQKVVQYPKYYEANIFLPAEKLINLRFCARYRIKQLGGEFFINKISGYNPNVVTACKVELIKLI